jgi:hypothetical protein
MRGMSVASSPTPMIFTLPKPSGAFRWAQLPSFDGDQGRPALVCDALAPFAFHFFTTRGWTLGAPAATEAGWGVRGVSRTRAWSPDRFTAALSCCDAQDTGQMRRAR